MKYEIQNNLVESLPTLTPVMQVGCRTCRTVVDIIGRDIPTDEGSRRTLIIYADIEDSITQALDRLGWEDLICQYCISNDPNIGKTYNDTIDRHEED